MPILGSSASGKSSCIVPKDSIVIKEGFLGKIGNKSSMLVSRYFVLRDHSLFVYHSKSQKVPSQVIFLRGLFINFTRLEGKDLYGFTFTSENKNLKSK